MRIPRLYCPADYQPGQSLALNKEQAHYMLTVLRLKNGRAIELFDGAGSVALGKVEITSRRSAEVLIEQVETINHESNVETHLVQSISKGDRMDYSIQKAVELGVNSIQPVITEHCDIKLSAEKLAKKIQQWQDIAINACEQSNRNVIPEVLPAKIYQTWLDEQAQYHGLVLNPRAKQSLKTLDAGFSKQPIYLLIGPEGGLSDEEVKLATAKGLTDIRIGKRVLRTETAGPAVLAAIQTLWGDF
jgi:16S rRNA (uracil1498-N3)-methyltransferase